MAGNRVVLARTRLRGGDLGETLPSMGTKKRARFPWIERHGDKWRGWWLDAQGVRRRTPSRATEAEAYDDARRARQTVADRPPGPAMTIRKAYELVQADLDRRERAPGTVEWYECQLAALRRYYDLDAPLDILTGDEVQRWVAQRIAGTRGEGGGWVIAPVSAGTVAHHLRFLRRLFRVATAHGWRGSDPLKQVVGPKVQPAKLDVLGWQEALDLVQRVRSIGGAILDVPESAPPAPEPSAAQRLADVLEALAHLGVRRSELARLRLEDIDASAKLLQVRGKRGLRRVPISDSLLPVLQRLAQGGLDAGKPVAQVDEHTVKRRRGYIAQLVGRWKRRTGDGRLRPHNLRRTLATALLERGVPEALIAQILGHAPGSGAVTRLYLAGREPVLREALGRLSAQRPRDQVEAPPARKRTGRRKAEG